MPAFQTTGQAQLQPAIPAANTRPVRVCRQEERRLGVLTMRRRRVTARGVQPRGPVQHVCAWFEVDGAVAPTTGERFVRAWPDLNAESCPRFVDAFAQACPERLHLLLRDHSGAHTAQRLTLPEHVRLVCWPPYGPERNPMERVWRDRKDALAWLQCPHLDAQHDPVAPRLRAYQAATRQTLTGDPSLVAAIHARCP
jgi:hypothetical protein